MAAAWARHGGLCETFPSGAKAVLKFRRASREHSSGCWSKQVAGSHDTRFVSWVLWDRFVRHAKEFNARLVYMHLNPVRKGLVKRPEDWRWSSYNNFALEKESVAACPLAIDYAHWPESYRG
jgi:hypothetical protein